MINMISTIVLLVCTLLFILMTVLPLVRSDYWTFRILEYPRMQKLFIGVVLLIVTLFTQKDTGSWFWWILGANVLCTIYLIVKIFPYTGIAPKEMKRVNNSNKDSELKIFTANVLQTNRNYDKLLSQIQSRDPDIIFLVETDSKWEEGVKSLDNKYTYSLKKPLDNTYGLLFFSRLPIIENKINFIVDKEIPSVEATIELPSGVKVKVYGLHPKPPVPDEALYSTAKDKELMKVALAIEKKDDPCIVMGDLNDVAWSYVTELFRKVSGLLDPRRGRGFYSTFSANHWWMRFPLDYIFCSSHFGLVHMDRLPHNGSDHFAMFIHLQYQKELKKHQEEPQADSKEKEDAIERATTTVVN